VRATLDCPLCDLPAFEADDYGFFHEDDEVTCGCGARLVVNMDDGTDCDCDQEGGCGLCDEWGQVFYAHVTVVEDGGAPCSSP
jgi:hypothetical protein